MIVFAGMVSRGSFATSVPLYFRTLHCGHSGGSTRIKKQIQDQQG
jgi:hypothetical protein